MIVQLRIDERLIHGQIAAAWARALPIDTIVCASDVAINDPLRSKMLIMAAPPGIKARVRGVDDVIKLLDDPRSENMKILLITDCPSSAVRLAKGLSITEVNVANYHNKDKENATYRVTETCVCDKQDVQLLNELVTLSKNVFTQMIPSVEKKDFKALLQGVKE